MRNPHIVIYRELLDRYEMRCSRQQSWNSVATVSYDVQSSVGCVRWGVFLDELNGLTLEAADFVVSAFIDLASGASTSQPCLQLQFGDYGLSVYNPMILSFGERSVDSSQPEFRDSIRELINSSVTRTLEAGGAVLIEFSKGRTLSISTAETDYHGPEAIVFTTPTAFIVV